MLENSMVHCNSPNCTSALVLTMYNYISQKQHVLCERSRARCYLQSIDLSPLSSLHSLFSIPSVPAVVLRLLSNPPPGETGFPVLLQDGRHQAQVDGAVRDGHVRYNCIIVETNPFCSRTQVTKWVLIRAGQTSNQREPLPTSTTSKCTHLKRTPTAGPVKCCWGEDRIY